MRVTAQVKLVVAELAEAALRAGVPGREREHRHGLKRALVDPAGFLARLEKKAAP
jgi:hypothetical protein